jgi:hypothetical protein
MNNLSPQHFERIQAFFNENCLSYLNVNDYLNNDDFENLDFSNAFEEILEILEDKNAFDIEIIYYRNAIEYLCKHDASLVDSLELAHELGYDIQQLTSETLASLLASSITKDAFFGLSEDIFNFFVNFDEK